MMEKFVVKIVNNLCLQNISNSLCIVLYNGSVKYITKDLYLYLLTCFAIAALFLVHNAVFFNLSCSGETLKG